LDRGRRTAARVVAAMVTTGVSSRKELEIALGLGKATVSRTVDRLLKGGYLWEGPKCNTASRGRKTTSLRVRSDLAYLVGTDLEGRAVRACMLDCSRRVVASGKCSIGARWPMARILREWSALLEDIVKASGAPRRKIASLGAGLPGVVSRNGFHTRAYLPPGQLVNLDPGSTLRQLGVPVLAANNVVCVSDYERRLGTAEGLRSFLSVLVRYGIGVAMCGDGSFLLGEETFTGELGHMRIDTRGTRCICGRKGCLDVFASGRTLPPLSCRKGRAWKRELSQRSRMLGIGIANLLMVFHPPVVILNGVYNDYETVVLPVLTEVIEQELSGMGLSTPGLLFGEKVEFKSSIGAALRAGDAFLQEHLMTNVLGGKRTPLRKAKGRGS